MLEIIIRIIKQKAIPFDIPLKKMQEFPCHEQYTFEVSEMIIKHSFKPTKKGNIGNYISYLKTYYKRKYKAYSIEIGVPQKQLKQ